MQKKDEKEGKGPNLKDEKQEEVEFEKSIVLSRIDSFLESDSNLFSKTNNRRGLGRKVR